MPRSARVFLATSAALALSFALTVQAAAKVKIVVDLDTQTIHVDAGKQVYHWQISSGADGYETPPGKYRVLWMDRSHKSDEYDGVPMPNAIFFAPGFAIHGTSRSPWGRRASHGCVRLPVAKSAILFALVKKDGADIEVVGPPVSAEAVAKRNPKPQVAGGEQPGGFTFPLFSAPGRGSEPQRAVQ